MVQNVMRKSLPVISGKCKFSRLCKLVAAQIPQEDWMQFARLNLNLSEEEIKLFRRKNCVFSEEQIHQAQYWTR